MKKIFIYLFLTVLAVLIGITTYFVLVLRPININVYSNYARDTLTLNDIKVYNYKYSDISIIKNEVVVYYRDLDNVLKSIKKNKYFNAEIDKNKYIFITEKSIYSLSINTKERYFKSRSLEVGYAFDSIPFIDDLMEDINYDDERLFNLKNYKFLPKQNFEGLTQLYKKFNINNLVIEDKKINIEFDNTLIMIKKINEYEISVKIESLKEKNR